MEHDHTHIAIVGTGFSGLGMAIRLKQEGEQDFVVLERNDDVGGTWHVNTYPGCACDVPSHLYSFSFAPNPGWSNTFSAQPEIWEYLRRTAREHGVVEHVRTSTEVLEAAWDDEAQLWRLDTSAGPLTADILIAGMGGLSEPSIPALPGLERFRGAAFHSATWDHDHDLTGERVAVIGTGASAIQFVPAIAPKVAHMDVYQRTAPWVMPRGERAISRLEKLLYARVPALQRAMRGALYWARESFVLQFMHPRLGKLPTAIARRHIAAKIEDPELRRKVTPDYALGCKRVLLSNDYLPALTRDNVDVVTDGILEIREHSIVTADGTEREVDTIVFGTGFNVAEMGAASRVRGRDGLLMKETWADSSPEAHLGTTIHGFPNLFVLVGPNVGLGHNSIVFMIESQINLVADALRHLHATGMREIEPRRDVQSAYNDDLQDKLQGTVWSEGGCASWYLDANGRNFTLWPGFTWPFRTRTRRLDPAEYELHPVREREPVAA